MSFFHSIKRALLLFGFLTTVSCGGSGGNDEEPVSQAEENSGDASNQDTPIDTDSAFDPGSSPYRLLRAEQAGSVSWQVSMASTQTVDINGEAANQEVNAEYSVDVELSIRSDGPFASMQSTVNNYTSLPFNSRNFAYPGVTFQYFDNQGRINNRNRRDPFTNSSKTDLATLTAFLLPPALLDVPEEAVGVNARWVVDSPEDDPIATRTTTVIQAMDETQLEIRREVELLGENDNFEDFSALMTATFDVDTLLLLQADVSLDSSFNVTVFVNGVQTQVDGRITQVRSIRSIAP